MDYITITMRRDRAQELLTTLMVVVADKTIEFDENPGHGQQQEIEALNDACEQLMKKIANNDRQENP